MPWSFPPATNQPPGQGTTPPMRLYGRGAPRWRRMAMATHAIRTVRVRSNPDAPWRTNDGLTLIELLITIAILGVVVIAVMTGITTLTTAVSLHQQESNIGVALRSAVEAVENDAYIPCTHFSTPQPYAIPTTTVTGVYTPFITTITNGPGTAVYWGSGTIPGDQCGATVGSSSDTDYGLQQVTIEAYEQNGGPASDTMTVLKSDRPIFSDSATGWTSSTWGGSYPTMLVSTQLSIGTASALNVNGDLAVNSSSSTAVSLGSTTTSWLHTGQFLTSDSTPTGICASCTYYEGGNGNPNTWPVPPQTPANGMPSGFSGLPAAPAGRQCTSTSAPATWNPIPTGIYCLSGGLTFPASTTVTSAPGGVFFYVSGGAVTIPSTDTVNISAPSSGTWAGVLIWQASSDVSGVALGGSGYSLLQGSVWAPSVSVTGTVTVGLL